MIDLYKSNPIGDLPVISDDFYEYLKANQDAAILPDNKTFLIENSYFKEKIKGTGPDVLVRVPVLEQLNTAIKKIGPNYQFKIFDGFRTLETQVQMFNIFKNQIRMENPDMSDDQLFKRTLQLVPHPNFTEGSYPVMPHNSGGAIDLTLLKDGKELNMGTPFDDTTARADTAYFESNPDDSSTEEWAHIRENRRILYNLMIDHGFTNHPNEWWHYNLGNHPWSELVGKPSCYNSMEGK